MEFFDVDAFAESAGCETCVVESKRSDLGHLFPFLPDYVVCGLSIPRASPIHQRIQEKDRPESEGPFENEY